MKKLINWLAYISLITSFVIGFILSGDIKRNEISKLEYTIEHDLKIEEIDSDNYAFFKNDSLLGYLAIGKAQGYGGPLSIVVYSDTSGVIAETALINSFESASFLAKLSNKKYYEQYQNMPVNSRFDIDDDVDAISGATVSSLAISKAIREASYKISTNNLNVPTPNIEKVFNFNFKEIAALLIFSLGIIISFWKKRNLKYITLFLGLVFFGFVFNESLSLTHFGRILLGYFPDIYTHFSWWLLIAGTLSIIIIWGKNVYCSSLCPFHASQIILNKISGINLKIPPKIMRLLNKTPDVLLWLSLILIFLSSNPTVSSYEPFALLFSLEGVGIQWYILPASLIGSLFFSNFFCRFFCPVGGAFRWILKMRKGIKLINVR